MTTNTESFEVAYDSYYKAIHAQLKTGAVVLEVGGGAHPSIGDRESISYTIVDPDETEINKAPAEIKTICSNIQDLKTNDKYDLIISKMVLEHVDDPDGFHSKIFELLSDNGVAIHFFACRYSLPALVNRLLPEAFGDIILRLLKNRDLDNEPKYRAYYKRTTGHTKSQLQYFNQLGFGIQSYQSYVGHKYLKQIPGLSLLEKLYTVILKRSNLYQFSTVALVVLKK